LQKIGNMGSHPPFAALCTKVCFGFERPVT
jgi:hypothetical protein